MTLSQSSLKNLGLLLLLFEFNYFLLSIDIINNIIITSVSRDQNSYQWQCSIIVTCLRLYHVTSNCTAIGGSYGHVIGHISYICPFFVEPISLSHSIIKLFFLTLQINLSFLFLKVVSSSSKNTNNPPPIYIKYCVNNKYVTFPFLSISFYFYFFYFFLLGEIFPQPLLLEVFKYFLQKLLILYAFVIFHK